jgi:predicted nuclease of predicted toxin-antitoxin system
LRFLLDVNVGSSIARALTDAGHEVIRTISLEPRAADPRVLELAIERQAVLITRDRDFGELMFSAGSPHPPGIIYIRAKAFEAHDLIPRLLRLLEPQQLLGHMVVLRSTHHRRIPFPSESKNNG